MLPFEGRSSLRSLRGETCVPFGGTPLRPSEETLASPGKTLNLIKETFAPLGGDLCSPRGDLCSLRGRPLLPSGRGLCSPGRSVGAGMAALPHSCRVIRLRALPGCDLKPGWASRCSEAGKCGACTAEWGPRRLPRAGIFKGSRGSNPIPADGSGGPGAGLRSQRSETPSGGYSKD